MLSLVLLAMSLGLYKEARDTNFDYREIPSAIGAIHFLIDTIGEGTVTSGPMRIEVHQGTSMSGDSEWTPEEKAQIELLIPDIQEFLEETFGPPAQQTEGLVVVITKVINQNVMKNAGEGVVGGYGHTVSVGPLGAKARMIPLSSPLNESDLVHEIKHAWRDDGALPSAWDEGQAMLAEMLYAEHLGLSPLTPLIDMEPETLFDGVTYEQFNTPDLHEIDWDNDQLEKKIEAYRMAGYAWYLWHVDHPDFFVRLSNETDAFFMLHQRMANYEEMIALGDKVEPGFSVWLSDQYIFPAQTK